MQQILTQFHFIRPEWLWLLPILPLLVWGLWRLKQQRAGWQRVIAPELLTHLIEGQPEKIKRAPLLSLTFLWLLATLALAGPSWQQLPQPSFQQQKALVYVVDLSPSMAAADISPTRIARLRYKLTDLIKSRDSGLSALIVYAGDAHVLAPLSDDRQTLLALLPTLAPDVMPIAGSNIEEAMSMAVGLLKGEHFSRGNIVLLTDGVTEQAATALKPILSGQNFRLSILGLGTERGAPIPNDQGYIKDSGGNIVMASLPRQRLQRLASQYGGVYSDVQPDAQDIQRIQQAIAREEALDLSPQAQQTQQQFDQWAESGPWLLLLALPLLALGFRRGWLLMLCLGVMPLGAPTPASAVDWDALWMTPDQRGAKAMAAEDHGKAAELFQSPDWRAAARYRQGDYAQAAKDYEAFDTAEGHYNRGNALAKAGDLQSALAAYQAALDKQPDFSDAKDNRDLVKQLLDQQQNSPQNNQQQDGADSEGNDANNNENAPSEQNDAGEESHEGSDQNSASTQPSAENNEAEATAPEEQQSEASEEAAKKDAEANDAQNSDSADSKETPESLQQQVNQAQAEAQEKANQTANSSANPSAQSPQESEQQQALKKWLGQLPEDASGLIRNKLQYEYQKKRQAYRTGQWQPNEEQRW